MVSFTHEQNIICSQTQLDNIAHEQTIICRQLFARGGLSANEKKEKFVSNDNPFSFSKVKYLHSIITIELFLEFFLSRLLQNNK